jgi:pSer/pThr/pTyr-binding forkhead associated (FHA) protein
MPCLVITEGPLPRKAYPLSEPITSLGRDDDCTIQILDDQVSRKHLQVRFDPAKSQHVAGDYRSANGVFVNGKQIVADVPLKDGDRIRIGTTTLMYLLADHQTQTDALAAAKKKDEWMKVTAMPDSIRKSV